MFFPKFSHCTLMDDSVRVAQPIRLQHVHKYKNSIIIIIEFYYYYYNRILLIINRYLGKLPTKHLWTY